jgi:sugar (pentulose or hexulose) kinase
VNTLFPVESVEYLCELGSHSPTGAKGIRVIPQWWSALHEGGGSILGLKPFHEKEDILRATLEGLAFEVRWALNHLQSITGNYTTKVGVFGGASQNEFFCQLLSNILELEIVRSKTPEASALGAAICAAVGLGWFKTTSEACESMTQVKDSFHPQGGESILYRKEYKIYRDLRSN